MLPEKTSSYITVLPATRSEIFDFVERFRSEMAAGYIEATKVAIQLKAMEELIKTLRADKQIREIIMDEVDKYTEKQFEIQGTTFEKAETGVRYDFSNCGSSKWERLKKEKEKIDNELKEEEDFLKKLSFTDNIIADGETGEILNPPVRSSNTYVRITLKK